MDDKLERAAEKFAYEQFPSIGVPNTIVEEAYINGIKRGLIAVKDEINFAAANGYKFPILHVLDYIDRQLGLKEDEKGKEEIQGRD